MQEKYTFRLPRYYVEDVLRNDPAEPVVGLACRGGPKLKMRGRNAGIHIDGGKQAEHPRWIQKYKYECLLRLTNFCSGLCRYCYLKNRENITGFFRRQEMDAMFDAAEDFRRRGNLREIVLSGGDPLTVPAETGAFGGAH